MSKDKRYEAQKKRLRAFQPKAIIIIVGGTEHGGDERDRRLSYIIHVSAGSSIISKGLP